MNEFLNKVKEEWLEYYEENRTLTLFATVAGAILVVALVSGVIGVFV